MYIDAHVHLRDFKESGKETIKHGLEVAYDSGVDAVFDMPNTDPPVLTRDLAELRIRQAREADVPVFYGLYMGITADPEQVKRAVETYRKFPNVVGMKLYAGQSVGNLGVIKLEDQKMVYETLAREGYDGVLAVHAEKESKFYPKIWISSIPMTHCFARPEKAEVESVRDQISLAYETGFKGRMHIAHISSPDAVELVEKAKSENMDISCGVCPHHIIYSRWQMLPDDGILMKMNPPLRSSRSRRTMLRLLHDGKIDWIETDHAPHQLAEKINGPYRSGIPGIPWWPLFEEFLRLNDFSDKQIEDLTFYNTAERFGLDIRRKNKKTRDRRGDYPFNPYRKMEEQLGWTNL